LNYIFLLFIITDNCILNNLNSVTYNADNTIK